MPTLSHISVRITFGDTALTEFLDPDADQEPSTSSCYILIDANKPRSIFIHIPAHFVFLSDVLLCRIFKDGKFVKQEWRSPRTSDDGARQPIDAWIGAADLVFAYVVEDTNANAPGDAEVWKDKEVVVQISHARLVEEASIDAFGNRNPGKVEPLRGTENTLAFTFKYRPHAILESILLPAIPPARTPAQQHPPTPQATSTHPADDSWNRSISDPTTKDNLIWCTCRRVRPSQPMITCDNDYCAVRTFHFRCVGLESEPRAATWLCPACRKLPAGEVRIGGDTDEFGPFRKEWIGNDFWY